MKNETKENLYLIEFYQNGPHGETGWKIQFAWVQAVSSEIAKKLLADYPHSKFDEVIQIGEHYCVSPLAMKKAPLFIRVGEKFLRKN